MIQVNEYAKALYMLTEESANSDDVLTSLKSVKQLLLDNPEYVKLLDSPAIPKEERLALIDSAFGEAEEMLVNFMKILCEKRDMHSFAPCADEYTRLYEAQRGIETAIAVSTQPLTDGQISKLKAKLEAVTGKTVVVQNEIDPSLIGGITLRFSGKQYDSSIKSRLDALRGTLGKIIV